MGPLLRGALCAALVAMTFAPTATARPDGDLQPYLDHLSELRLAWPAVGTVTDGFGPRWGRLHSGMDIGILRELDVHAAAPGKVVATGYMVGYEGYGNVVLVDVGDGYSNLYAHLSRVDVYRGNWVDRGQQLGLAGCTGSCTGTHLHFELHRSGAAIDPSPYLSASGP
jgi:murein DD-endopeptidase MepM/ murein hydrolase activator NlpD